MYTVLPEDVKSLDDLAGDLDKLRPSRDLDERVRLAVFHDRDPYPPCYTSNLDAAISLIPHGWWWYISHLEAAVVPNRPEPDIPINNATDYEFTGRPVEYSVS